MHTSSKAKRSILLLIILLCTNNLIFATRKTRSRKSIVLSQTKNLQNLEKRFSPCVQELKQKFNEPGNSKQALNTPLEIIVEMGDISLGTNLKKKINNFTPKLKEVVKKHYKKSIYGLTKEEIKNCRIVTKEQLLQEEKQLLQQKANAFSSRLKEVLTKWYQNKSADFSKINIPNVHLEKKKHRKVIVEPSPESLPGTPRYSLEHSDEELVLDLTNDSEKEKEDDFIVIESNHHDSLWTEEDLTRLPQLPFGQFLKAELEARNKQLIASSTHKERTLNLEDLATISMTDSFIEGLPELAKKKNTPDLSHIDDEEWGIIDALPETKFQDYHWKSKMINANKRENGVIAFFLIHGTFVDHNEFGKDNETKMTQDLVSAAKRLALDNDCAVKLISFQWSGELSASSRKEGANILKRFFTSDEDCMQARMVTAFSHSFGGDVLLQFADLLKPYNKTLDWVVMAGTPLGESTTLNPVSKSPRIIEPTDYEQCFNIKKVFQFFSRGDITQAAGSRQMTLNLLNPLGTAERRLPLRINHGRNVVNCHVEHNGELCSHVNIKWHIAAALHLLLPMIENDYPFAHDLNVATCDDNKEHLPIITLRNRIFSSDCAETNHRSFQASEYGEEMFKRLYNKTIGAQNNWTTAKAYYEMTHARYSQNDQGRADLRERMAQSFEN